MTTWREMTRGEICRKLQPRVDLKQLVEPGELEIFLIGNFIETGMWGPLVITSNVIVKSNGVDFCAMWTRQAGPSCHKII